MLHNPKLKGITEQAEDYFQYTDDEGNIKRKSKETLNSSITSDTFNTIKNKYAEPVIYQYMMEQSVKLFSSKNLYMEVTRNKLILKDVETNEIKKIITI